MINTKLEFAKSFTKFQIAISGQRISCIFIFQIDQNACRCAQSDPRKLGQALKGSELGEFWKYRVGSYRIIAAILDNRICILVLRIGNRKEAYK